MNITQQYIPNNTLRRSGQKNDGIKYIVCHDTGNDSASALDNADYYTRSAGVMEASAHAFIDDKGVIEVIPLDEKAWHVRYSAGIAPNVAGSYANDCSIGIELCYSTRGKFSSTEAYKNYVQYIAMLLEKYNLGTEHLVSHSQLDPTRRTDPHNALSKIGKTWEQFVSEVGAIISAPNVPQAQPITHMDITKETPQKLVFKKVTVTYDQYVNGELVNENHMVDTKLTDELKTVIKPDLVVEGWNIEIE